MKFGDAVYAVIGEYNRAVNSYPPMNSAHEGYAVILEEIDELWEVVRQKDSVRSNQQLKEEAIQVAAMALRFLIDVC